MSDNSIDPRWMAQHEGVIGDLQGQIRAREHQIQAEREGARRLAAERAEAARLDQEKLDRRLDEELEPRKRELRREYRLRHDGFDTGFEAFWARVRQDEVEARYERQIQRAMKEMGRTAWMPASEGTRRMVELGPED